MRRPTPPQGDLFGDADPLIGLCVKLDREIDRRQPCHENVVELHAGRGGHAYALFCERCGRFRGWLPKAAAEFLTETIRVGGIPRETPIYRDTTNAKAAVGADGRSEASAPDGDKVMDISKFLGAGVFRKVADLKDGPINVTITNVQIGKFDKINLGFNDGSRLSCNTTNCRALARAYGTESDAWVGQEVELFVGLVEFQGREQEAILVRPVSPPLEKKPAPKKLKPDFDDEEIPLDR
jgi:hypothetical protein